MGHVPARARPLLREEKLFPLEEAVRRMTALPAQQFRLTNRGSLAVGAYADSSSSIRRR